MQHLFLTFVCSFFLYVLRLLLYDTTSFELKHSQKELIYDCVNSVHCHPSEPIIGASVGQRHYDSTSNTKFECDSDSDDSYSVPHTINDSYESSIQFWKLKM